MKKNNLWVWILAALTAAAGIAVAVALFVKRAGKKLQKDLDFDDSIYFEEEDSTPYDLSDEFDEDEVDGEEEESEEDDKE